MRVLHDDSGQGMVEYGLIIGLIAIAVVVAMAATGDQVIALHNFYANSVENVTTHALGH